MRKVFDERTSMKELSLRLNFVLHVLAVFVMPLFVGQVVFAFETAPRVEWRAALDVDDVALSSTTTDQPQPNRVLRDDSAPTSDASGATSTLPSIAVVVDDRVTLLSIVARLAGAGEYTDRRTKSPYSDAVDRHFSQFRDHPVVELFRRMRAKSGVSYDAPMSLACHVGPLPELQERVDFSNQPERLDARWTLAETREFLAALRDFVETAGVVEFLNAQRTYEEKARERLARAFDGAKLRAWCDEFFGARETAVFEVRLGLLNGPHNYGVGARMNQQSADKPSGLIEEITPVIGCWQWDAAQGLPTWPQGALEGLIVHELCHSYVNAEIDRSWAALEPASQRLLMLDESRMRAQAYGTARIVCYETVVRACVVRYFRARAGEKGEAMAKKAEVRQGFLWVPAVADALAVYEATPVEKRDFTACVLDLVPTLTSEADRLTRPK
jgi:hypothetical protein